MATPTTPRPTAGTAKTAGLVTLTSDTRAAEPTKHGVHRRPDKDIHDQLEGEIVALLQGPDRQYVRVTVRDGEVMLTGRVPWRHDIAGCHRAAEEVLGVTKVKSRLDYVWDDRF
jgi:BON domain-containing protein